MGLLWKLKTYHTLSKLNVNRAWTHGNLRESEKMGIIILIAAIALFVSLQIIHSIDDSRIRQHQRATSAENAVNDRELIIASMMNGRVKIEGVHRTVKLCNAAGECND